MAYLGLLDDAAPLFRPGQRVPGAGVLLALRSLIETGVFTATRQIYGSIGPAFYGLRTTILTLLLMALLLIKRPEALKEHSPTDVGRVLGLDRAPEVKTIRRKLTHLAGLGGADRLGQLLAARRVAMRGEAPGFLYVDGHVRIYYGKRRRTYTYEGASRRFLTTWLRALRWCQLPAFQEARPPAHPPSGRHPELLPREGPLRDRGGHQRQHPGDAAAGSGLPGS